jgi:hypothetical protein
MGRGRDICVIYCPLLKSLANYVPLCSLLRSYIFATSLHSGDTTPPVAKRRMQRIKDVDHLAVFSDASYPVGPDTSGEITYVHVPPLGPLSSTCSFFVGLTSHLTSALLASNHHSARLYGSCRIHLVLRLSHGPEVARRQHRQGRHQTADFGIHAVAVRPAPAGVPASAAADA